MIFYNYSFYISGDSSLRLVFWFLFSLSWLEGLKFDGMDRQEKMFLRCLTIF